MKTKEFVLSCPVATPGREVIQLAHGGGGRLMHDLLERRIFPALSGPAAEARHDSAVVTIGGQRLAFTTDSYVVRPRRFPGGDIGKLAVCGTINDLAMAGATPLFLSVGLILEEGLELKELDAVLASMRATADASGVELVTGDTKVVDRGKVDGLFINTAGIGRVREGIDVRPGRVRAGDRILLSGDIGRHGIAVLSAREGLDFESNLESDCASLDVLAASLTTTSLEIHCMRDPTRGGLATALNEIAKDSGLAIEVEEAAIPVCEAVRGACELLGLDPLYVPCEGRMVVFLPDGQADWALDVLRQHSLGRDAAIIGRVMEGPAGTVTTRTHLGGRRILDLLSGEQLPRIC